MNPPRWKFESAINRAEKIVDYTARRLTARRSCRQPVRVPAASHWFPFIAALAAVSCAKPADPEPQPAVAAQPAKPYKKPPRLNGRGKVSSISLEDFFLLQQSGKALIFDCRPAFFYHLGHIPGAISLPVSGCDDAIHRHEANIRTALAEGKTLVTYCTGFACPDARTVAMHFSGFGFPASVFSDGWHGWKDADMPTTTETSP